MANSWEFIYHNLSSHDLHVASVEGLPQGGIGELNHQPGDTLAVGQKDYLAFDQSMLKWVAEGSIDFTQSLGQPGAERIYLRMVVPMQVIGIGYSPYWYYHVGNGHPKSNEWGDYYYGDTKTVVCGGMKVTISGVSSHQSLSVTVVFEDEK
jgi:hypothetical protein